MKNLLAQNITLPNPDLKSTDPIAIQGLPTLKITSIGDMITGAIPFIFAFAGIGLLLMIISAGFTLLTSAGDAKKLEMGKGRLTYALAGFFIIFLAYWIVQLAGKIFGLGIIDLIFK